MFVNHKVYKYVIFEHFSRGAYHSSLQRISKRLSSGLPNQVHLHQNLPSMSSWICVQMKRLPQSWELYNVPSVFVSLYGEPFRSTFTGTKKRPNPGPEKQCCTITPSFDIVKQIQQQMFPLSFLSIF